MTPQNPGAAEPGASLRDLEQGTTIQAALSFYDSLPPVTVEEMVGAWKGRVPHRQSVRWASGGVRLARQAVRVPMRATR